MVAAETNLSFLVQPTLLRNFDFESVIGPSDPTYWQIFPGVFGAPDPPVPAWCHSQIWPPKMVISENRPKPGLRVLYG